MIVETKPPIYILALTVDQPNVVTNIFELGTGAAAKLLERPGEFRWAGWDMNTLDRVRIVDAAYLEVRNGARKRIQLYEDGTFIARGSIDTDFLGWKAAEDRPFSENPRVHSLAIIEFTTAAVFLYQRLIPLLARPPRDVRFHVEIKNAKQADNFLYIVPFRLNTLGWAMSDREYVLTNENPIYDGVIDSQEVLRDPARAAFIIVARLMLFFGVPIDKVPYAVDSPNGRRIDVDEIRSIK